MKLYLKIFIIFLSIFIRTSAQNNFIGTWQGLIIYDESPMENASVVFLDIKNDNGKVSGFSRFEANDQSSGAIFINKGQLNNDKLYIENFALKQRLFSKQKWCPLNAEFTFNDSTGYLVGNFSSKECKRMSGKMILYPSQIKKIDSEEVLNVGWRKQLIYLLQNNLPSPIILALELKNFKFETIYFDYDKFEIKPEYQEYLLDIVRMIKSHSDIRVKIIGHTDSDGGEAYNDDLSKKRAHAIRDFLISQKIDSDRIVIEYKGEKKPIGSNETKEGKQMNRRVDFEFI